MNVLATVLLVASAALTTETFRALPVLSPAGVEGEWIVVRGQVLDTDGEPVGDATVFAYHTDPDGQYHDNAYRGTVHCDDEGRFAFRTLRPGGYGPSPHVHFQVSAPHKRDLRPTLRLSDSPAPPRTLRVGDMDVTEFNFDIRWE